jgi:hypothetical protein
MLIEQQDNEEKHPLITDIESITAPRFEKIESRLSKLEHLLSNSAGFNDEEMVDGRFSRDIEAEYIVEKQVKIPYVQDIAAGPPIEQSDDQSQFIAVPERLIKKGGRYYAASIRGGSMTEAGDPGRRYGPNPLQRQPPGWFHPGGPVQGEEHP